MTDARLRGEWLTAAAHDALSDVAYRVFHNGLMHAAEQGTDGFIATRELRFLYPGPINPQALAELEEAGFWESVDGGYRFLDWSGRLGQSTAVDVEKQRASNRARKQSQRAREKAARTSATMPPANEQTPEGTTTPAEESQAVSDALSHRDSRRDVTPGVGQERIGQAEPVPPFPVPQELNTGERETTSSEPRAQGHDNVPVTEWSESLPTEGELAAEAFSLDEPRQPRLPDEPRPYPDQCERHQADVHTASCRDCGARRRANTPRPTPKAKLRHKLVGGRRICDSHPHVPTGDGSCVNCEIHADDLAALTIGVA